MRFVIVSALALCLSTAQCQMQTDSFPAITILPAHADSASTVFPRLTARSLMFPSMCLTYGVVALHNHQLIHLNHFAATRLHRPHSHFSTHADNYLQYVPGAAVFALDIAGVQGKNTVRDQTMIYGLTTLLSSAVVLPIKRFTRVERPDGSAFNSFPSGHTTTAFAYAEFLRQEYKGVSAWYGIAGYATAAATGALRMCNNRHWLSDVVAGAGLGVLSSKTVYAIYPMLKRKLFKDKPVTWMVCPYYGNGGGLACVHHLK